MDESSPAASITPTSTRPGAADTSSERQRPVERLRDAATALWAFQPIARQNHGRTPEKGLDCTGLVLWLYGQSGLDLYPLDLPYGEEAQRDSRNAARAAAIAVSRGGFAQVRPFDATRLRTGDMVVIRAGLPGLPRTAHLGIVVDEDVYHFADKLYVTPNVRLFPLIGRVLRHPRFLGVTKAK
jgi:cell wall-associated NlpC family hydrolase